MSNSRKGENAITTLILLGFSLIIFALVLFLVVKIINQGVESITESEVYRFFVNLINYFKEIIKPGN